MRVCRRCGVYAPPETRICDGCSADLREHATVVSAGPYRCAAVRIEHTCTKCGRPGPVDGLPPDGALLCAGCGESTEIAPEEWSKVLGRIHAAADLVGEDPEGFEPSPVAIDEVNRFHARARTSAGIVFGPSEADAWARWLPNAWRVWVAPGIPMAPDSSGPLELAGDGSGEIVARSSQGLVLGYAVDPRWTARHRALVGAIAASSSVDGATSRRGSELVPDTWWLAFSGPSAFRAYLERDPSTWAEPHPDERGLGELPIATPQGAGWLLAIGWAMAVPLAMLGLAGFLWTWTGF